MCFWMILTLKDTYILENISKLEPTYVAYGIFKTQKVSKGIDWFYQIRINV